MAENHRMIKNTEMLNVWAGNLIPENGNEIN
jgi:hypothetical protein